MRELKDPEIKLFGKKIALPENGNVLPVVISSEDSGTGAGNSGNVSYGITVSETSNGSDCDRSLEDEKLISEEKDEAHEESDDENHEADKDHITGEFGQAKSEEKKQNQMEELENTKISSESDNNAETPIIDEDSQTVKSSKNENDQNDATNSQQKTLKKPDKILPCPRCNSMDTKFCYYNNYNVNQPRHFCKSCQRYWTAGGTMRNVPVGAGRRKNKNSTSYCRHITISEALQAARIDPLNGFHHPTFQPNGTVLSFGPDSPFCESMASGLNLGEKKVSNGIRNGFYGPDHQKNPFRTGGESGDGCSSGSSVTTSNSMADRGTNVPPRQAVVPTLNGFAPPVPCLAGVPWPYPWNAAVRLPAICPPGYPMPFCPPGVPWPYPWSMPWLAPPSPTDNQIGSPGSLPTSPLGKHSREGDLLKNKSNIPDKKEPTEPKSSERSVLVPKTLRIDDPDEAAKSSIWSTLGIKYDSVSRGGLFKALQPKTDGKDEKATGASLMMQANPAALSRSLSFHERA